MNAIVTGAGQGLGLSIKKALERDNWLVYNLGLKYAPGEASIDVGGTFVYCNVSDSYSVNSARDQILDQLGQTAKISVLINNAGINEISKIEKLPAKVWDDVMGVNAKGIFLVSQAFLPILSRSAGTILNITSNAAWVPMSHSLVYNASKAAAHMMTIQMAHEFHRRKIPITCFAVAPGKLSGTSMSKYIESRVMEIRGWTREEAEKYQLASLKAGGETDPRQLAEFIAFLLHSKERHSQLAGCVLPYGA